jgi:predicted MPP superfamily phosphohydrolase
LKIVRFLFICCAVPVGILIYARFIEPSFITVEKIQLSSEKFGKDFTGLHIVFIADLHLKSIGFNEKRVIRKVNSLQPDVVLIGGDLCYSTALFNLKDTDMDVILNQIQKFIGSLKSKYGIYVCRGNNDMSDDKEISNALMAKMDEIGVRMLTDRSEAIHIGTQAIYIMGIDFPDFFYEESNDFRVVVVNGNHVLASGVSKDNSYSHYYDVATEWSNYEYSGRMRRMNSLEGGIGFTFYSQFYRGYDWYYRFRGSDLAPFHLAPHATSVSGVTSTDTSPERNVWYRFKVQVQTLPDRTLMRIRVWQEGDVEPKAWQCDAYDDSPTRLKGGTVGVWSSRGGVHQFDDLCVTSLISGDTLLYENFESTPEAQVPVGWIAYNFSHEALPMLMKHIPDSCYTILLGHTPDFVLDAKRHGIDLVLSGHTHGGQICLPFFGPLLTRTRLGPRYARGLFHFGKTTLYVNRGLGTILYPYRFNCPPEITVIDLKKGDMQEKDD